MLIQALVFSKTKAKIYCGTTWKSGSP